MNINLKEKIKNFAGFFGQEKNNSTADTTGRYIKKIAIFQLLFIFIFFALLPEHNAHAIDVFGEIGKLAGGALDNVGTMFLAAIISGISLLIYHIGNFALMLAGMVVYFGAWLIDLMMDQGIYKAVLVDSSAIGVGWKTIRDFCNMFFIFFLLIVAFATILRISEYSAKTILPKFLIAIFMINFSMEITKLVIDFGQVFMYEIRGWMGDFSGPTGGSGSLTSIVDYFIKTLSDNKNAGTPDAAITVLFAAAYSFMLGFTYIMMAGFLLIRLLMFAVLMILSPFAFFCNIFPGTRRYASEWWGSIVKYSLFGPIFIFFVFISATMSYELINNYDPTTVVTAGQDQIGAVKNLIPKLIPNIIALMMLWMAIPITQKLGIAGSSRLIGGTLGLGTVAMASYGATKLAGGWGKKAAGGVASRTSLGAGYNKLRDAAERRVIARIPVVGKGIVMSNMASREKEKERKMKEKEAEYGALKNIDLGLLKGKAEGVLGKTGTTDDKALLLKAAAAQGKLNDPEYRDYLRDHMAEAERSLSKKDLEEITGKNLGFVLETYEGKTEVEKYKNKTNSVTGNNYTDAEAKDQVLRDKISELEKENKINQIQDLDNPEIAGRVYEGLSPEGRKRAISSMPKDQQAKWAQGLQGAIKDHGTLTNRTDIDNNLKMITAKIKLDGNMNEILTLKGADDIRNVSNIVEQLNTGQLAHLSEGSLDKASEAITMSQIKNLLKAGENEMVNKIKDKLVLKATGGTGVIHTAGMTRKDIDKKLKEINDELN